MLVQRIGFSFAPGTVFCIKAKLISWIQVMNMVKIESKKVRARTQVNKREFVQKFFLAAALAPQNFQSLELGPKAQDLALHNLFSTPPPPPKEKNTRTSQEIALPQIQSPKFSSRCCCAHPLTSQPQQPPTARRRREIDRSRDSFLRNCARTLAFSSSRPPFSLKKDKALMRPEEREPWRGPKRERERERERERNG